jgi:YD repeat-containing protein
MPANGNMTTRDYDGFDRPRATAFPSKTVPGNVDPSDYTQLTYDPNGNVITRRTRKGETIVYSYDALNRLTFKDVGTVVANVAYGYDLLGSTRFARFGSSGGQGITMAVDALGRLKQETTDLDGIARTVNYDYDVAGRRTKLTYPAMTTDGAAGPLFTYTYDVTGAMKSIAQTTAPAASIATFTYDLLGARATVTRVGYGPTTYTYDPIGRLAKLFNNITATGAANDVTYDLTYNPAGQIVTRNVTTPTPANYDQWPEPV